MKHRGLLPCIAIALPGLLLPAAGDMRLEPGSWQIRTTPGVATLNGQSLNDLPIGPIKSETICLTAVAAAPARFFARDMDGCTSTGATAADGRVRISGTCPSEDNGPPSTYRLAGTFGGTAYDVSFATTAFGENGRMTFSGRTVGKRISACPEG